MRGFTIFSAFVWVILMSVGCGAETRKGDSAQISVRMANGTAALNLAQDARVDPKAIALLSFKPIAVRISTDNQGGYMIWGSKTCAGASGKAKVGDKEYEYFSEHTCASNVDGDSLNLLDVASVNQALNAQTWPVPPGTYHYVSIIMCSPAEYGAGFSADGKTPAKENLAYQVGLMSEIHNTSICDPYTGFSEAGITVSEGQSLTVQLEYNLAELFDYLSENKTYIPGGSGHGCYATDNKGDAGSVFYCPKFGAGALKPGIYSP